jgi:DivIVA domain-containing protein
MTTAGQDPTFVGSAPRLDSQFPVKLRGYCRDQVDAHLRAVSAELADAREACRLAELRAEIAEADRATVLAELRQRGGRTPEPRGAATPPAFGLAVERARRAAECEAQQARLQAAREANEDLSRARREPAAAVRVPEPRTPDQAAAPAPTR